MKSIEINESCPTKDGLILVKNLKENDYLLSKEGKDIKILSIKNPKLEKCYKITLSDHSNIIVGENCNILTETKIDRLNNITRTDEFKKKRRESRKSRATKGYDWISKNNSIVAENRRHLNLKPTESIEKGPENILNSLKLKGSYNHFINNCKSLELEEKEYIISPYLLGLWLGDGTAKNSNITTADPGIFKYLNQNETFWKKNDKYQYCISGLITRIKSLGLFNNKYIPINYLKGSKEQRLDLLKGLMDTDGCATKEGKVFFSNCNKNLINCVEELVRTLGLIPFTKSRKSFCMYKGERRESLSYDIRFAVDLPVFNLNRKLVRQKLKKRFNYRWITNVEYIGEKFTRDIIAENQFIVGPYICL